MSTVRDESSRRGQPFRPSGTDGGNLINKTIAYRNSGGTSLK
jgi:hypothetical protein